MKWENVKAWAMFGWICAYAGGWFGFAAFVVYKVSACVVS